MLDALYLEWVPLPKKLLLNEQVFLELQNEMISSFCAKFLTRCVRNQFYNRRQSDAKSQKRGESREIDMIGVFDSVEPLCSALGIPRATLISIIVARMLLHWWVINPCVLWEIILYLIIRINSYSGLPDLLTHPMR